jgi:hypothetical protein
MGVQILKIKRWKKKRKIYFLVIIIKLEKSYSSEKMIFLRKHINNSWILKSKYNKYQYKFLKLFDLSIYIKLKKVVNFIIN